MFQVVREVGVEGASAFLVASDDVVHPFDGYTRLSVAPADTGDGIRRPLPLDAPLDFMPVLFRQFPRHSGNRLSHLGELMRVDCDVVSVHVGVPFKPPADGRFADVYQIRDCRERHLFRQTHRNGVSLLLGKVMIFFHRTTQK